MHDSPSLFFTKTALLVASLGIAPVHGDVLDDLQQETPVSQSPPPDLFSEGDQDGLNDLQAGGNSPQPQAQEGAQEGTVRDVYEGALRQRGLETGQINQVMDRISSQTGVDLGGPIHDRVDFTRFPNAQVNVTAIDRPAALVITPTLANYVFTGKPDSFQGSFRSYEFHIGRGFAQAANMIFRQVFTQLRVISSPSEAAPGEAVILPTLGQFRFEWGGSFSPVMYVSLGTGVQIILDGRSLYQGSFPVDDIKEDGQSIFPTEDQEHRAISTALIESLKQSVPGISAIRAQLKPLPPVAKQPVPKAQTQTAVNPATETLDMSAVMVLAFTWKDYHTNKHRLNKLERIAAVRILRIRDAYDARDEDRQFKEIQALTKIAKERNLTPESKADLIHEIKRFQGNRDAQSAADIAEADAWYNFAGDDTDTVLEYTGLGIDLVKTGVMVTGCTISGGAACPALIAVDAAFMPLGVVAEGVGAGTAKLREGGTREEAAFETAKAMMIDFTAGKLGDIGGKAVFDTATHHVGRKVTQSLTKDLPAELLPRANNAVYLGVMDDIVSSLPKKLDKPLAELGKEVIKNTAEYGESLLTGKKADQNAVKNTLAPDRSQTPAVTAELKAL